ncbi:MAG: cytochrome c oxidase assembly protein [Streptosporangiaceae bacterium]|nr:cytochrome c oxidase assembly protein [Streptosporangiaceae bacterium]MBV9856319.1 cytochrome c oxidase assembly protein [Streptosporangiaceae bacterium]
MTAILAHADRLIHPPAAPSSLGCMGMGSHTLPPFGWMEAVTRWQFAAIATELTVAAAALYLLGVWRVRQRHPARPWPLWRTAMFLGGLLVIVIATQSGVGTYDDVLFWDHMIQHLMLIMIAPPMLVLGQPITLLLHASRNPLHTRVKRVVRSRVAGWLTWPPFGIAAYTATIVGTHLTSFMNVVMSNGAVQGAEHLLYLVVGYLYFLPLIGREPIRWRVSYPVKLFLLFLAMPVDAFTGVVLGSASSDPFAPMEPPGRGPSTLTDVHAGGAVMWIGGAGIMFVMIMVIFFAWSRDTRPAGGMGWLESARRANLATMVSGSGPAPARARTRQDASVDDDEHLAAYNAYLARLHGTTEQRP